MEGDALVKELTGARVMAMEQDVPALERMRPGGKPLPFNHSPFFAPVPEPSIKTGVQAMSLAVLNVLGKG